MEPLSGTASVLTILEATARVSKATTKLYWGFRDAPEELAQLCANISRTQSRIDTQLHIYQNLSRSGCAIALPADVLQDLETDLGSAVACLDSVRDSMAGKWDEPHTKQRLTWAFKDKREVTKIIQSLRDIDHNLSALLGTVMLAITVQSNERIFSINENQLRLMAKIESATRQMNTVPVSPTDIKRNITARTSLGVLLPRGRAVQSQDHPKLRTTVTIRYQKDDLRSCSWILGTLRLPWMFSSHAIYIAIQLWLFKASWPHLRHSISVKTIVPRGSKFMMACAAGSLRDVRQLALDGYGSPSSIDETGEPALHHAIRGGSLELVRFLLQNGATVDDLESRGYV